MSHQKVTDKQLADVLLQYANAPGDLWVRITRDCDNARKDLNKLMCLLDSEQISPATQEAIKQLRSYYEWQPETKKPDPPKMKIYS